MRIEEMRSGRAYLGKRVPVKTISDNQSRRSHRDLRARISGDDAPSTAQPQPRIESELDKNQWSVVSFNGVEAGGLTYDQASRLMRVLGDNDINGLCIITDAAALKID